MWTKLVAIFLFHLEWKRVPHLKKHSPHLFSNPMGFSCTLHYGYQFFISFQECFAAIKKVWAQSFRIFPSTSFWIFLRYLWPVPVRQRKVTLEVHLLYCYHFYFLKALFLPTFKGQGSNIFNQWELYLETSI